MRQLTTIDKFKANLLREYWEYRKILWGIPLVLSALIIVATFMAVLFGRFSADHVDSMERKDALEIVVESALKQTQGDPRAPTPNSTQQAQERPAENPSTQEPDEDDATTQGQNSIDASNIEFGFMGLYMVVSWLAAFFYFLSCLYTDRRDHSVLYWKSLPVSETNNVLSKFVFGAFGFCIIAIAIAWLTALILLLIVHGLLSADELALMNHEPEFVFNAKHLFLAPIAGLILGVLWGAPWFTYLLMISSISKRLPLLMFILPLVVIYLMERIFFQRSVLVQFLSDHRPSQALLNIAQNPDISAAFAQILFERGESLIAGLLAAGFFLLVTLWCRNQRFEI